MLKNKFKCFFIKIKNWLFSLSKWAQKHKLKLFALVFSIFLLTFTLGNNKSKTASATTMNSTSYVLVLPSVSVYSGYRGFGVNTMPIYIGANSDGDFVVYYARSSDGTSVFFWGVTMAVDEFVNANYLCQFYSEEVNQMRYSELGLQFCTYSISMKAISWSYVIQNAVRIQVLGFNSAVYYDIYDANDTIIFEFVVTPIGDVTDFDYENLTIPFFISSNLNSEIVAEDYYNNGYNTGFRTGYDIGYDEGYNYGISLDPSEYNPLNIVKTGVDGLLDIELFGDVSLGIILKIIFGVSLVSIMLKLFMGG